MLFAETIDKLRDLCYFLKLHGAIEQLYRSSSLHPVFLLMRITRSDRFVSMLTHVDERG